MAPDSRLWRHQLGEATHGLRRSVTKAALPVCFLLATSVSDIQARTEPTWDTWSQISAELLAYERPARPDHGALWTLPPAPVLFNSSSAGRWNNRIQIHSPIQPSVEKYTRFFEGPGKATLRDAFDRAWRYIPVMADILNAGGVPPELLSVVLIESRFQRHASHGGAGGYWQLLAPTARSMGLRVDRWVDERKDPVKSTCAAARYLRSFYDKFHCWSLALAAYNAGDNAVTSALRKHGTNDYQKLSERGALPGQTLSYVAKVLAAVRIMNDPEAHGFECPRHTPIYDFESIRIRAHAPLHLERIAGWVDVPVSTMRDLNPSLRMDCLPPEGGFDLNLPSGARDRFDLAYADFMKR